MADVKREIKFNRSMTADKRNSDFAYLRKGAFSSPYKGLYPAISYVQELPDGLATSDDIEDILGSEESNNAGGFYKIKVIVDSGSDIKFYNLGSNSTSNTTLTGKNFECGAFGEDGVYIVASDDNVYAVRHVNSNTSSEGVFLEARPDVGGFDGLYYWWASFNEIYKQIPGEDPVVAFNNIGITPRKIDFLNDQMIIFAEEAGGITILFWDKSDLDLFDKRIFVPNAKFIAGGVVNGRLMLIKGIGNSANAKEQAGEIVISAYDGEKFQRLNSIRAGQRDTEKESWLGFDRGSEVMLFSVTENTGSNYPDLYQNYIYKIRSDGSIEADTLPDETYGETHIVRVFYNFTVYATRGDSGIAPRIYVRESTSSSFTNFDHFDETTYITNFMCEPYNFHKLTGMNVAFEKLFKNTTGVENTDGEELDIYYRVSERDSFTLLGTVTCQKVIDNVNARRDDTGVVPIPEQRYQFTKMPDGSALPQFNEIQFKFVSRNGFSIIAAWFEYDYLSRNTLN